MKQQLFQRSPLSQIQLQVEEKRKFILMCMLTIVFGQENRPPNIQIEAINHASIFREVGFIYPKLAYSHLLVNLDLDTLVERRNGLINLKNHLELIEYPEHMSDKAKRYCAVHGCGSNDRNTQRPE